MSSGIESPYARRFDPIAFVAVSATVLCWGGSYSAIRTALAVLSPVEISVIRYAAVAVVAVGFLVVARPRMPNATEFVRLAVVGVLYVAGFSVLLNWGQQTVPAGAASFIVSTSPVMIAILAVFALREPFGWISRFGAVVSFAGVALIAIASGDALGLQFGALLVLGAALSTSVASTIQKPLMTGFSALVVTAWILILGVLPLLPALPGAVAAMSGASAQVLVAVAFLAVFSTMVAYIGWSLALQRMPAGRAGSFLNGVPLAATVIAYAWLGEVPSALGLVGGLVALAGVIVVNAARGR